jgi:hypothetical protein
MSKVNGDTPAASAASAAPEAPKVEQKSKDGAPEAQQTAEQQKEEQEQPQQEQPPKQPEEEKQQEEKEKQEKKTFDPTIRDDGPLKKDPDVDEKPAKKEGLNREVLSKIFEKIYIGLSALVLLFLFIFIILTMINFAKVVRMRKKQNKQSKKNDIIVRDTIEYSVMAYAKQKQQTRAQKNAKKNKKNKKRIIRRRKTKTNTTGPENLLYIYPLISVINVMLILCAVFLLMVFVQISSSLALYFLKEGKSAQSFDYTALRPSIKLEYGVILFIGFIVSIVSLTMLKGLFAKKAISTLAKMNQRAYNMKALVYSNVYVNKNFLDILTSDSVDSTLTLISRKIDTNVADAYKMIYTFNLYNHYNRSFTASSPYRMQFKESFTYEGFKMAPGAPRFDPVEFLIYGDKPVFETPDYFMLELEARKTDFGRRMKRAYTTNRINGDTLENYVRTRLANLTLLANNFSKSKLNKSYQVIYAVIFNLLRFIFIFVLVLLIIMTVIVLVMFDDMRKFIAGLIVRIVEVLKNIVSSIMNSIRK